MYFILCRVSNLTFATSETDRWYYYTKVETEDQVKTILSNSSMEFKVIKGEELPWEEEYEDVVSTQHVLKSRKLKI